MTTQIAGTELRDAVARKIAANPSIKTAMLAEALGVPEADVLRAWPERGIAEIDPGRIEDAIRALERLGTVYVVVRNEACVMESWGAFGEFSRSGPYLNVSTTSLHLHIRVDRTAAGFAVERPGHAPGTKSFSFQFFDRSGASAIKAFCMLRDGDPPRDFAAIFALFVGEFALPAPEVRE